MTRHTQVICTTLAGERIAIDEKIAPFVQRLWNAGMETWTSCQWDGSPNKTYPAYINSNSCSAKQMAEILGLERWQWKSRNDVLWLHKDMVNGG